MAQKNINDDGREIVNSPNTKHKKKTHVKYNIDYSFLTDSGQVFYHVKYFIWGLVISILLK